MPSIRSKTASPGRREVHDFDDEDDDAEPFAQPGSRPTIPSASVRSVLEKLPRPPRVPLDATVFAAIPKREREVFRASILRTIWRLICWSYPLGYYYGGGIIDWLRGRANAKQRGRRLRIALERMGATFVKVGQQLSTRLDVLPTEVCYELAQLLENIPPIPLKDAIAAIERVTGKPLNETFAKFDPEPVGSASVACVYHAVLRTGEDVAVKVRRPNIGKIFAADLAALDLVAALVEALTFIRPGFTKALRAELRSMFMEELDFRMEARYQELFRRKAKKDRQKYVSAPKVFFEHSGRDVIVMEFVTGVWLTELLVAKETDHHEALAYYASLNIIPEKVAKRLLRARHWSTHENLFYHADPHPANLVVQPNNKLVFIDFGACGPTTYKNRRNNIELFRRQAEKDVEGMVQVFHDMLSPLPPIEIQSFTSEAEAGTFLWLYGFESKNSEWWEHTSAEMWLQLFEVTKKYGIPVNAETIRLMRSTLLYDTVAARLYKDINLEREFHKYERGAGQRAMLRTIDRITDGLTWGRVFLEVERLTVLTGRLFYRLELWADLPTASFFTMVNKAAYAISNFFGFLLFATLMTSGLVLATLGYDLVRGTDRAAGQVIKSLVSQPLYWSALFVFSLRWYRRIQYRLRDPDEPPRAQ